MGAIGRNDPCPCGSGRKVKRCCGVRRGPGAEDLARAELGRALRAALPDLVGIGPSELHELVGELEDLPALDLSLVLRLPDLLTPELARLLDAVADDDDFLLEPALEAALAQVATQAARAALARAVLALRDAGRIRPRLAAVALLDLAHGETLVAASLLEAAAIATGRAATPGGLRVAA
jgi:predicted transcriptional regulator